MVRKGNRNGDGDHTFTHQGPPVLRLVQIRAADIGSLATGRTKHDIG